MKPYKIVIIIVYTLILHYTSSNLRKTHTPRLCPAIHLRELVNVMRVYFDILHDEKQEGNENVVVIRILYEELLFYSESPTQTSAS